MNPHRKPRQILILLLAMTMIGISAVYTTHTQNQVSIPILLLYSFDCEEEQRACKAAEQEVTSRGKETG